jgi:hypothetical protein
MEIKHLARDETSGEESRSLGEADAQTSPPDRTRIPILFTVPRVGQHLGLPDSSIYRLIRLKILPAVRIGRRVFVAEDDLLAFIRNGGAGLN